MRTPANYPNRIKAQTERIRKIASTLPAGQRNTLLNACGLIDLNARRYDAAPEIDNRTPAQQNDQIAEQYNTAQRIVAALLSGRTLSQRDSREFKTTAFHSRIADARRIIARQYPEATLCSRYTGQTEAGRPYKLYWIENSLTF